jgi:hypothetical protein
VVCCVLLCHRAQAELEESLIDEELQRLLGEYVESRVREALASEHVQASLAERLKVGLGLKTVLGVCGCVSGRGGGGMLSVCRRGHWQSDRRCDLVLRHCCVCVEGRGVWLVMCVSLASEHVQASLAERLKVGLGVKAPCRLPHRAQHAQVFSQSQQHWLLSVRGMQRWSWVAVYVRPWPVNTHQPACASGTDTEALC